MRASKRGRSRPSALTGESDPILAPRPEDSPAARRLARLILAVKAIVFFENAWRIFLPPLLVALLFICLAWLGLFVALPPLARLAAVALLAAAGLAALLPALRWRLATRKDALARLDRSSGLVSRPASVLVDHLANLGADPATEALWALHRRRAEAEIARLHAGLPSPRMADRDHYALRAAILVGLAASAFVAGPEKYSRIAAAFDWHIGAFSPSASRVDAWIDAPAYTAKPPIILSLGSGEDIAGRALEAPVGSILVIRASGQLPAFETSGGLKQSEPEPGAKIVDAQRDPEARLILTGDARLVLELAAGPRAFDIKATPDLAPTIAPTDVPTANARGSLTLAYRVGDDYGVISAEASFANPILPSGTPSRRSLTDPPRLALSLPPAGGVSGEAETIADLSEHPWAGARATMSLKARDARGSEGQSAPIEITLPQKPFTNPLAHALAEQRRNLVLAPDDKDRVATALDALMIAPDKFGTGASAYLGLHIARARLAEALADSELAAVADFIWEMALQLESGDLSTAERDLRAAEQALREALARNAPEEEIRQLVDHLRAAMDKFLRAFAAQEQNQNGRDPSESGRGARSVDPAELQAMLDKMEEMTRSGSLADAQKMLEQLQNILENLKMARPRQADPRAKDMNRALDDLSQMSRDEQDLRDETYQRGQSQRPRDRADRYDFGLPGFPFGPSPFDEEEENASDGASPPQGPGMTDLAQRQNALRDRLEKLRQRLEQLGHDGESLSDAKEAMEDAESALNQKGGKGNAAVSAQGRAIEALREGAQKLAEAMQGEDGSGGEGGGQEGQEGGSPRYGRRGGMDPLGRMTGSERNFDPAARFDPLGVPAAQRAQRVLEELRRRLAEPARSREELDYLERLLRRY